MPKELGKAGKDKEDRERERSASRSVSAHSSPVRSPPPTLPALSRRGPRFCLKVCPQATTPLTPSSSASPSPIALPTLLPRVFVPWHVWRYRAIHRGCPTTTTTAFGESRNVFARSGGCARDARCRHVALVCLSLWDWEWAILRPLIWRFSESEGCICRCQWGMGMDLAGSPVGGDVGNGGGMSESELGFGFPAQEGFGAAYGAARRPQERPASPDCTGHGYGSKRSLRSSNVNSRTSIPTSRCSSTNSKLWSRRAADRPRRAYG